MAFTLSDLTYRTARLLGLVSEGTATGGTTSTIIDTNSRIEADNYWKRGTAWILRDSAGAGAAPEGEFGIISSYDLSSNTITLESALTVAPASGDRYAIAKPKIQLHILIQMVNNAIMEIGGIPATDTSTVETADNKTEYTLPAAANRDLVEVWIQRITDDANDNRWIQLHGWHIERTATGTADELIMPYQITSGREIKLVYITDHTEMYDFDDELNELIPIERVIYQAALECMMWYKLYKNKNDYDHMIEWMEVRAIKAEREHPIDLPRKSGTIGWVSKATVLESEPDKVYL